ncbi:MAG: hypothetical protein HYZ50_00895 [Deltaproteobacteria bacterium]|nr:hypothetical protein [Deltaproteobacteria bacterium]
MPFAIYIFSAYADNGEQRVMLSGAKHLSSAVKARFFTEFTLSEAEGLR